MAVNLRPQAGNSCSPDDLGFGAIDTALRLNAPDPTRRLFTEQNRGQSETNNIQRCRCAGVCADIIYRAGS